MVGRMIAFLALANIIQYIKHHTIHTVALELDIFKIISNCLPCKK